MIMLLSSWRAITVWRLLALVFWHPSHYVGCTEQRQNVQPLASQDVRLEEETEERTPHHKVDENLLSHVQSLSEHDLQTAGYQSLLEGDLQTAGYQSLSEHDPQTTAEQPLSEHDLLTAGEQSLSEHDLQTTEQSLSEHYPQTTAEQSLSEHDLLTGEQSLSEHDLQTAAEQSLSEHDPQTTAEQSLSEHDLLTAGYQSLSEHDPQTTAEHSLSEHDAQTAAEQSLSEHDAQTTGEQSLSEHDLQTAGYQSLLERDLQTAEQSLSEHDPQSTGEHSLSEHDLQTAEHSLSERDPQTTGERSLSEHDLRPAGEQVVEGLATQGLVKEEDQGVEALEMEQPVSEMEPERGALEPEPEPEPHPPQTSMSQDLEFTSDPEPTPQPSVTAAPEYPPSTLTPEDLTSNSVSDDVTPGVSAPEVREGDQADCESEDTNPFDDASPPVVLENTSNAHSGGTKTHMDPSSSPQAGQGTQSRGQVVNTSHLLNEKGFLPGVATETDISTGKDPEDNPTFDEWKRKVMEVEKEKTQAAHITSNGSPHPAKKVPKNFNNYASVECGAKVLGSNPEAKSTSAILMENMDMYMLNPCSNKIWFIIELCEPIQLKQLDIANFELFSSTPKDFLVSISDRYPTNKWLKLGTFHGRDERTVQSFPLDEHLYAKYIKMFTKYMKVELVSHFGSEHFCPLSLLRVFGTSMVEEYEEIADPSERPDEQDDEFESSPGYVPNEDKSSKNLIGSAKDVILSMVNNIAGALGGSPEMEGNFSSQELNTTETSSQLDTIVALTTTTTLPSVPDTEDVDNTSDPDVPAAAESPSPETPVLDVPATEPPQLELPLEEDKIVTPLPLDEEEEEEEEEESISSTIILLDPSEEDDEDEGEERRRRQESLEYCGPLFSSSSSSSCSVSLQEYLRRQCSPLPAQRRERHPVPEREPPPPPPPTLTFTWQLPVYPSACPTPPQPPQIQGGEHTPGQGQAQGEASASEPPSPPPLEDRAEAEAEWRSEPSLLEPSQTSALPRASGAESPAPPRPTATMEPLPQPEEEEPRASEEVLSEEEEEEEPTATVIISIPVTDKPGDDDRAWGEDKPHTEVQVPVPEPEGGIQTADVPDPSLPPAVAPSSDQQPAPPAGPESNDVTLEASSSSLSSSSSSSIVSEPEPSNELETPRAEDLAEDVVFQPHPSSPVHPAVSQTHSEFYAELHNVSEQQGGAAGQVHGSNQKESVFMRLNNRIKALEMNMSLSGRYLEQLSQRYRRQMEEMQKAFNTTVIKLQNTSRIAEEQDQRQTESIQSLQGQLENITQMVLNLSVRVSQLQREVSDRQSYLMLCLVLCLFLGLFLCANHCRLSTAPPSTEPEPVIPYRYSYCCPESEFTSYDDPGLKRAASYPLLHSESYQLPTTEDPESLHTDERQRRLSPANRRKKRSKVKHGDKVETLRPSHTAPELLSNGAVCNGAPRTANPPARGLLHPFFKDSPSEGSSEGSSHSDDPSFCGIASTVCTRFCDGLPPQPPGTRAERRALRRSRRSKPGCMVVDVPHAPPRRNSSQVPPLSSSGAQGSGGREQGAGTFGVSIPLAGPV